MVVPYWKYQLDDTPFGLTLPDNVAAVTVTTLGGPVTAVGGDAADAPVAPSPSAAIASAPAVSTFCGWIQEVLMYP